MSDHALPDRGHPTYPPAAADWLVGRGQRSVLEVGACSGGLTSQLVGLGHDVHATDPSADALADLAERHPGLRTTVATADYLPVVDASVDVVLCDTRWRDHEVDRALAECARVLRPGGHLALVSASQDTKIPWVRRLAALLGSEPPMTEPPEWLVRSDRFGFVDTASYRFWQDVNPDNLDALALAQPAVAALEGAARDRKLAEVRAFYADYGRGMDGMQLPWVAHCFKSAAVENPWSVPPREGEETEPAPVTEQRPPEPPDDSVLIDFR